MKRKNFLFSIPLLAAFSLLISALPAMAQSTDNKAAEKVTFTMDGPEFREPKNGPQVLVPKNITVTRQMKADFFLYYFTVPVTEAEMKADDASADNKQILFAYLGYHPSFAEEIPKGVKEKQSKINEMPARTFAWKNAGRFYRETLVDTGRNLEPGTITDKVHFSYRGLTSADAKIADTIIASLKPFPAPAANKKSDKTE